jgi:hypothetical protein
MHRRAGRFHEWADRKGEEPAGVKAAARRGIGIAVTIHAAADSAAAPPDL